MEESSFGAEPGSDEGLWLVRARGEIDLESAPRLEAVLAEAIAAGPNRLIVDLESVEFLDSTGLRVLVEAQQRLDQQGGTLLFEGISAAARRTLEVTGLLQTFSAEGEKSNPRSS